MKGSFKTALIAAVVSAFVAAGAAVATTQAFTLGTTNTVDAASTVTAGASGLNAKLLQLTNNNIGSSATALGLTTPNSRPPMIISSGAKVANLNADKLDGIDSTGFLPKAGKAADSSKLGGQLPSNYLQYASSSFSYPAFAVPQPDGHVATFTFTAPVAGFALVTGQFQVRVKNNGTDDCRVESQLATAPAVIGKVLPGQGSPGFVDDWVNSNLPTQNTTGGTYLGLNMSVSNVFPVVAGSNTIYLNGQYNNYGVGEANCADALWGPISMSAVFANQKPSSTLTTP